MSYPNSNRKFGFIINPIAGHGHSKAERIIKDYQTQHNNLAQLFFTEAPGHASELASKAIEKGLIPVAVGGDGTVNEVAQSVIKHCGQMGLIPRGSGNGVARHLGISMNPKEALQQLLTGEIQQIDSGTVNDKTFVMLVGFGFDAVVAYKMSKSKTRGLQAYVRICLQEWQRYKPKKIEIEVDGDHYTFDNFMTSISNASQFGNNFYQAPLASVRDCLLDIGTITPFPMVAAPDIALRMVTKSIDASRYKTGKQGKSIKVVTDSTVMNVDGEAIRFNGEATIQIKPSSLSIIRP
jgi:YegS/Rv2252/BmrU family lipid kinase